MKHLTTPAQGEACGLKATGPLSRRSLFAGATGIGAAAAVATLLPASVTDSGPIATAKLAPLRGGGYTMSEHVKQYYKTALI